MQAGPPAECRVMRAFDNQISDRDSPVAEAAPVATCDFIVRAETASKIAASNADVVDRDARFPLEAFEAIRVGKLLSMAIPRELGGEGASPADVADVCAVLGGTASRLGVRRRSAPVR